MPIWLQCPRKVWRRWIQEVNRTRDCRWQLGPSKDFLESVSEENIKGLKQNLDIIWSGYQRCKQKEGVGAGKSCLQKTGRAGSGGSPCNPSYLGGCNLRITVLGHPGQITHETSKSKITRAKWTGGVAHSVKHLLRKCKALQIPVPPKKKKRERAGIAQSAELSVCHRAKVDMCTAVSVLPLMDMW
jgi:hypothetical protein